MAVSHDLVLESPAALMNHHLTSGSTEIGNNCKATSFGHIEHLPALWWSSNKFSSWFCTLQELFILLYSFQISMSPFSYDCKLIHHVQ